MSPLKKKQFAKWITVFGAIFWIIAGTWGVISCLQSAREMKAHHVTGLQISRLHTAIPAPMPNEHSILEQLQISGLDRSPYLFTEPLFRSMLVFALCVIVSLFVLYGVMILTQKEDMHLKGRHERGDGVYIVR